MLSQSSMGELKEKGEIVVASEMESPFKLSAKKKQEIGGSGNV